MGQSNTINDQIIVRGMLELDMLEAQKAFNEATQAAFALEGTWLDLMNRELVTYQALRAMQAKAGEHLAELHRLQRELSERPKTNPADLQA